MARKPLIIGHRGASREAPENTLAAFELALRQGADGVEADFRLTRDGQIVCLHDADTARTGSAALVVEKSTLAELRTLDLGSWKGAPWQGERIPLLSEVLALVGEGRWLFIEIKSGPEIVAPLAATLAASAVPADRLRLLCFSAQMIRALKDALPGYRACWLTDYRRLGSWRPSLPEILETLAACGADGLASRDQAPLDRELVGALRERALELHVWTVDSAVAGRRLRALGVDSIMTNRPGWLGSALAESEEGRKP